MGTLAFAAPAVTTYITAKEILSVRNPELEIERRYMHKRLRDILSESETGEGPWAAELCRLTIQNLEKSMGR